jgi:endoglucanase
MAAMVLLLGFGTALVQATPTIVEVRTAAPNVIVAVVQTDITYEYGTTSGPDSVDTAAGPGHWQVNGGSPTAIHRYSVPWDELPEVGADPVLPNYSYPVTTRHRIYLVLSSPLQEGATYTISNPSYGTTNWTFSATSSFCESIKVNQVGYSKRSTSRYANFGVYMGNEGAGSISMQFNPLPTYKVYNQSTGAILTNGTAVFITNDTALANSGSSGEYVYRLSLNYVPEGGPYYVSVDGAGRSRSFGIGDNYSSNIAYVTMRGMYLHRCGIALTQPYTAFTHAICHTNIYDDRSTSYNDDNVIPQGTPPMFIQGGYHDAGDFDQSAAHYLISVLMLSFYEAYPNLFADSQYNIPESGNGIPDFLDETMWGLKVWEYLQVTNNPSDRANYGGVRGGFDPNGYPKYGVNDCANDTLAYGTLDEQVDVTAQVAGIFAQASRLIRRYDSAHADVLLNRAQLAWNWLANSNPSTNYTAQMRVSVMYAALQLYLATTTSTYHDVFQSVATSILVNHVGYGPQDGYECGNNYYFCQNAHFVSYLLPGVPNPNTTLQQNLKNLILGCAQTGTFMGPPPESQPYPQGVTKFMGWGAATAQGRYADTWMYACLLTNDTATLQRYTNAVAQYADFSLGLNPMNMSYYTGLGTDQPNSPTDCNSYYTKYGLSDGVTSDNHRDGNGNPIGNVPGILVYGPTDGNSGYDYQMAIWKKLWPAWDSLPAQRHYAHGWSLINGNEFTVQETMVWNVLMYSFLYPAAARPATTAQRASGPMTIDGNLSEAGWIITNTVTRTIIGTDNNTVTFGALWDDTYLYVGAKVLDANLFSDSAPYPWQDDALEIYIDGNHNRGTSYDTYDRQIVKGWNTGDIWVNGNQTNGILQAWAPITGGYSVEVAIPWGDLGITPSSGAVIGFDVGNDDDDNGGDREGQDMWAGTVNNWTDTSAFGDLTLVGAGGTQDTVWVDDQIPAGGISDADGGDPNPWNWITSNPTPELGAKAHQSNLAAGEHQHFFSGATATLSVVTGDTMYCYIYIDPANPPSTVMLQWNDETGSWNHRAYWGPNNTGWGPPAYQVSASIPVSGTWVRLEVPASAVGLEGHTLNGMAFTLAGGRAAWDNAGKSH